MAMKGQRADRRGRMGFSGAGVGVVTGARAFLRAPVTTPTPAPENPMRPLLSALCPFIAMAATAGCATAAAGSSAFELRTDDYQRVRGDYVLEDGHVMHVA